MLIGRLHSHLIHLPLSLIFFLFVTHILSHFKRWEIHSQILQGLWILTLLSLFLTAFLGHELKTELALEDPLLNLHQNFSWALIPSALFSFFCERLWRKIYPWALSLTVLLALGCGYYGGMISKGTLF